MKIVNEQRILQGQNLLSSDIDGISLIRIPEMYLIAAEALLEKEPEKAREYFDTFITSRGLVGLADRQPAQRLTAELIRNERRKEFIQEGQEWFNMKREMRDFVNVLGTKITGSDLIYTIPIPDSEFEYRDGESVKETENDQ